MTMEDGSNDFDLYLKDSNGNRLDYSWFELKQLLRWVRHLRVLQEYVNITAYARNYTLKYGPIIYSYSKSSN